MTSFLPSYGRLVYGWVGRIFDKRYRSLLLVLILGCFHTDLPQYRMSLTLPVDELIRLQVSVRLGTDGRLTLNMQPIPLSSSSPSTRPPSDLMLNFNGTSNADGTLCLDIWAGNAQASCSASSAPLGSMDVGMFTLVYTSFIRARRSPNYLTVPSVSQPLSLSSEMFNGIMPLDSSTHSLGIANGFTDEFLGFLSRDNVDHLPENYWFSQISDMANAQAIFSNNSSSDNNTPWPSMFETAGEPNHSGVTMVCATYHVSVLSLRPQMTCPPTLVSRTSRILLHTRAHLLLKYHPWSSVYPT